MQPAHKEGVTDMENHMPSHFRTYKGDGDRARRVHGEEEMIKTRERLHKGLFLRQMVEKEEGGGRKQR